MIEIEVQNETHQTQTRMRFAAVPRIGEGLRLREPDGIWASYDVLDVWYQKAEFGDVWTPYLHVCLTPETAQAPEIEVPARQAAHEPAPPPAYEPAPPPAHQPVHTPEPTRAPVPASEHVGYAEIAEDVLDLHEDDTHDLTGEDQFASLGGEARPFKI